jgi:hypothetical protein
MSEFVFGKIRWVEERPNNREKTGIFIFICFLVAVLSVATYFHLVTLTELKQDRVNNNMETTRIFNLQEEQVVKVKGTIESDYGIVIAGTWEDDEWTGTAHGFLLNDSGSTIPVRYYGNFDYPQVEVVNAPHRDYRKETYHYGDSICIIGDHKIENGESVIYARIIAMEPDAFYHPFSSFLAIVLSILFLCILFGIANIAMDKNTYIIKKENEWVSCSSEKLQWINFFLPGVVLATCFFTGFYLYSAEKLFLVPTFLFFFMMIFIARSYYRCKSDIINRDFKSRTLVKDVSNYHFVVKRVTNLLRENKLRFEKYDDMTKTIKLKDFKLKLKFLISGSDDNNTRHYYVSVKLGPITPDLEYTVGWKLKSLIDKEFGKVVTLPFQTSVSRNKNSHLA